MLFLTLKSIRKNNFYYLKKLHGSLNGTKCCTKHIDPFIENIEKIKSCLNPLHITDEIILKRFCIFKDLGYLGL